ncbi:MAG TPA: GNAT family N-acetyltransferase [Candidatus Lokiarchaeia archaeon]|nr:GNAT family N-acetyltransferase [Candidatus Lokiarchaeia archaeon]
MVCKEGKFFPRTKAPPLEIIRQYTLSAIASGGTNFVALDDSQVVGWCGIYVNQKEGCQHSGDLGMGLLAKYRGQGIGTELLHGALCRAKELGLERVELEVLESNLPAITLYEKRGISQGRQEGPCVHL